MPQRKNTAKPKPRAKPRATKPQAPRPAPPKAETQKPQTPTNGRPPGQRYLYSVSEALVFLRTAGKVLSEAEEHAPDAAAREAIAQVRRTAEMALRQAKEARNRTFTRYTPQGQLKPNQKAANQ